MTEWRDEALVLTLRPYGESAAIVELFTRVHGRHSGVVRGGTSRRMAPYLQPGTHVQAVWRARHDDQLGHFTIEPVKSRAHVLSDRLALSGLLAVASLAHAALPDRAPHPDLWVATGALLDDLGAPDWPEAYLRWEMRLLEEAGYGLDLTSCAVSGATEGLSFVSPRTGRAVTATAAGEWADRLLPMPPAMASAGPAGMTLAEVVMGLRITGHFLSRELGRELGQELGRGQAGRALAGSDPAGERALLPDARARLIELLSRQG